MENNIQQSPVTSSASAAKQAQTQGDQTSVSSHPEQKVPVEFSAEMRVRAVEPITGVEVEFGYEDNGEWFPVRLGEGPSLFCHREQLESWLTHPDTLMSFDGPLDLEFSQQCVAETLKRCLAHAQEVLEGKRPVPDHPIEVWPLNGFEWRVEPGQLIPPGITHIRPVGPYNWQEVVSLLSVP